MTYLIALVASFVSVFLKGFQHKNVIRNLYFNTVITSYLMAVMDVVLIGVIVKAGWSVALVTGTGAAAGMAASMYIHNRMYREAP